MKKQLFMILVLILMGITLANALSPPVPISKIIISALTKSSKALPEEEIIRLSMLSNSINGTKRVGKELDKLNLPNEVLEDAFMRIAIYQSKISRTEADEMFSKLSQTEGFRTTLRKIIGNSDIVTAGHLNELRIANTAASHGFKVVSIGAKFDDPAKKALTDIDLILQKGNKTFIVEAKYYAETSKIPLDHYRADLDTLIAYKGKDSNIIPIFTFTNKPTDPQYLKSLQSEADKRGVQLIFGEAQETITQIKMLGEIL